MRATPSQLSARSGPIHDSWCARPRWRTIDFVPHSQPGHRRVAITAINVVIMCHKSTEAAPAAREEELAGGGTRVDAWTALISTTTTTVLKP